MNNEEERSKQNPATQAPMEIESNTWFLAAALVEEKNTLIFCFGFDFFMGFWGLEVESETAFGEKGKEE